MVLGEEKGLEFLQFCGYAMHYSNRGPYLQSGVYIFENTIIQATMTLAYPRPEYLEVQPQGWKGGAIPLGAMSPRDKKFKEFLVWRDHHREKEGTYIFSVPLYLCTEEKTSLKYKGKRSRQ